jgi:hypothetical protein
MGLFDIIEIGFNVQSVNNSGALTYIEIKMKLSIDNSITTLRIHDGDSLQYI